MILQFSQSTMFFVILLILLFLSIGIAFLFKVKDLILIVILFCIITTGLYFFEVLTLEYAAIAYVVLALMMYGMYRMKGDKEV